MVQAAGLPPGKDPTDWNVENPEAVAGVHRAYAEAGADGRSRLDDDRLGRIAQGRDDLAGIVSLRKSAGRADRDTLSAVDAAGIGQGHLKGRADVGLEAAVVGADAGDALSGLADSGTTAAKDTFAVVTVHMDGAVIDLRRSLVAIVEALILDAKLDGQALELAGAGADAGQAGTVVVGEQQLHGLLAGLQDAGGVGEDFHALVDGVDAGRDQGSGVLDLDNAHTAGADLVDLLHVTERRDTDTGDASSLQNGGTSRSTDVLAVYLNVDIFHLCSLLLHHFL